MSAGALAQPDSGPVLPGTGWLSPDTFPITHRLHGCLLLRAAGHTPLPLGLSRAVPVRGQAPLRDGPGDTAGHRGRAEELPALVRLPRMLWKEPALLPGGLSGLVLFTKQSFGPRPLFGDAEEGLWGSIHCQRWPRTSIASSFITGVVTGFSIPWIIPWVESLCHGSTWGDSGERQRR